MPASRTLGGCELDHSSLWIQEHRTNLQAIRISTSSSIDALGQSIGPVHCINTTRSGFLITYIDGVKEQSDFTLSLPAGRSLSGDWSNG
ncbi:MAG: hypothetical protein Q7S29_05765 [Candidatus Peribacter sp.]|nr:hypothetical protein [Candidatus Peribacter sp.]